MKIGDYKISDLYQGGYSSLEPGYGNVFTGYRASVGTLGITTDPRTANILKEVSDKLSAGQKAVELSLIEPEIAEIAKPQMKETKRLAKLTGVDVSVHGPLIEASGLSKEGFSEANRQAAERQMFSAVESAHEVNPDGSSPITFHSSAMLPGVEVSKRIEEGKEIVETEKLPIIDQETGQVHMVKKEEKYYLTRPGEKVKHTAEEQVGIMNETQWGDSLAQVEFNRENAERIIKNIHPVLARELYLGYMNKQLDPKTLSPQEYNELKKVFSAHEYLKQAEVNVNALFNKAYKYGTDKEKEELKTLSENYTKLLGIKETGEVGIDYFDPHVRTSALFELTKKLTGFRPELYKSIPDFAFDKSATTFGNIAYDSYRKFRNSAPIISIENPPAGMGAFARGEDLKKIVEASREKFVERAVKEGMSKSEAKSQAEKLIGVTWDVGHINLLRKFGFEKEDITKETEKIAPYLKHIHLSDNFGMEHVEMPMGMGDVPLKEMMEKLGKKAEDVKKIVEAAHWWQHFKTSPMQQSFEAMGSSIYAMKNAPYWNQSIGLQQGYFSGYGQMLPPIHYETLGAGFAQTPMELGGQRPGAQGGRMSGTPME